MSHSAICIARGIVLRDRDLKLTSVWCWGEPAELVLHIDVAPQNSLKRCSTLLLFQYASDFFAEVPWRLFEDAELLKSLANRENLGTLSAAEEEALNVHSRTDLVEGLFKPVLQFLRKSKTEIAVVVFSAVNGNTHTKRNAIAKGSDLADSLAHAEKQLESFLQSGGPYSDNEHDVEPQNPPAAPSVVRVGPHSAYYSPLLDSFVKKSVTFDHFAEITELIDKFWGALLPRHSDAFVGADEQIHPMRDSQKDPEGFRQWQRSQGAAFLAKPVSELRDAKVRLLLLVDDPLLAWFITTQSQHQVMAFVKADHMYDVSYKSESHFAPCASPHTARNGKRHTEELGKFSVAVERYSFCSSGIYHCIWI